MRLINYKTSHIWTKWTHFFIKSTKIGVFYRYECDTIATFWDPCTAHPPFGLFWWLKDGVFKVDIALCLMCTTTQYIHFLLYIIITSTLIIIIVIIFPDHLNFLERECGLSAALHINISRWMMSKPNFGSSLWYNFKQFL